MVNSTVTRASACTSASAIVSASSSRSETRSSDSPARAPTMPNTRASTGPAAIADTSIREGTSVCTELRTTIAVVTIQIVLREGHCDLRADAAGTGAHLDGAWQSRDQRQPEPEAGGPGEYAHAAPLVAHGDVKLVVEGTRLDLELRGGRLRRVRVDDDVRARLRDREADVVGGAGRKPEALAEPG